MSDRFPGQIWIGGQLSRIARLYPDAPDDDTTILQGLIDALHLDGASHEYGDRAIDADFTGDFGLAGYLNDGGLLHLKQDQAVNGEFPETEQFCIEHGIAFDRNSDHYCEYNGENVHWRPGMNSVIVTYADSSGKEIVGGDTVRQAMKELTDSIAPGSTEAHIDHIAVALRLLNDVCPELPPELEKFKIVA